MKTIIFEDKNYEKSAKTTKIIWPKKRLACSGPLSHDVKLNCSSFNPY